MKREEMHEKERVKDGKGRRRGESDRMRTGDNSEREGRLGRAKGAREEERLKGRMEMRKESERDREERRKDRYNEEIREP